MHKTIRKSWILYLLAAVGALSISAVSVWALVADKAPYLGSLVVGLGILGGLFYGIAHHGSYIIRIIHGQHVDELTGLLTRKAFFGRLSRVIANADKHKTNFHLLILDINNFKQINDALGHKEGDKLLKLFADKLKESIRDGDDIARLSGDEFAVILHTQAKEDSFLDDIDRIIKNTNFPLNIGKHKLHLGLSIGVSTYPDMGSTDVALMRCADIAMVNAKRLQKDYCIYEIEEDKFLLSNSALIGEIRLAIDNGDVALWAQPKKNLITNEIDSIECLIRWDHQHLGILGPDTFIHLAESAGIIKYITHFVIKEATNIYKELCAAGYDINVAINISPNDMSDPSMMTAIIKNIVQADMSPEKLILEVTETAIMQDPNSATKILLALESLGVKLAIDDFGTGHSSLRYLKNYPIREIKFDKSFISDLETSNEGYKIVKSNIELAHSLNAVTVAEGVETAHIESILKDIGCDYIQGYYLAKPMPIDTLIQWLNDYKGNINE